MSTKISRRGYLIKKTDNNKDLIERLKDELVVTPVLNSEYNYYEPNSFKIYRENSGYLSIPRFKGIQMFGKPDKEDIHPGESIDFPKFNGELRDLQKTITTKVISTIKDKGGGILVAPCGIGKTIMAVYIASILKVKTFILVHQENLIKQWRDAFREFLKIDVGVLQRKKVETEYPVVVGMIQTMVTKNYPYDTYRDFGLTIVDECHHTGAEMFSKALPQITTKYMLGLSATPERKDGLSQVFKYYLGDIAYEYIRPEMPEVTVKAIYFKSDRDEFTTRYYNKIGKPDLAKTVGMLVELEERNELICKQIKFYLKDERRNIIILSQRREHATILQAMLAEMNIDSGLYMGSMKQKDLERSMEKRVLLATYSMASEGFDCPKLNVLIMCSPKVDVTQSVGRILRKKTGVDPVIVDIVDKIPMIQQQHYKRRKIYKKLGYTITKVDAI